MKLGIFLVCLMFPFLAIAEPELKGTPQEIRGFLYPSDKLTNISGFAEEKAYSDKAIVQLVVKTEEKRMSAALSSNSKLREKITEILLKAGIEREAIKSSKFSTSPQFGWFGSKPDSYEVVNRMAITVTSETQLQAIAAIADDHGEVELSDTHFEHSEKEAYKQKVKQQALQKIMQQKAFYEKTLGVKLVAIGIRELHVSDAATAGAMLVEEVVIRGERKSRDNSMSKVRAPAQGNSFDEVIYRANLSVDFKIE